MKETFKNNIKVTAVTFILILAVVFYFIYSAFYGNPFDKIKARKEIEKYIENKYSISYKISEIEYNVDTSEYSAYVALNNDEETKIFVSYNLTDNRVIDTNK